MLNELFEIMCEYFDDRTEALRWVNDFKDDVNKVDIENFIYNTADEFDMCPNCICDLKIHETEDTEEYFGCPCCRPEIVKYCPECGEEF